MTLLFGEFRNIVAGLLDAGDMQTLTARAATEPAYVKRLLPIEFVARAGRNDIPALEALLAIGAMLDATNQDEETALAAAATTGALEALKWLLARGASVEAPPAMRRSMPPLLAAASEGHASAVELLIDSGANLTVTFGDPPRNALDWAEYYGHAAAAERLRQAGLAPLFVAPPKPDAVIDRRRAEIKKAKLDLGKDMAGLRRFLTASVEAFNKECSGEVVSNVHIFFAPQNGLTEVQFGTGTVVNPFHRFEPRFKRWASLPHWQDFTVLVCERPTTLTGATGETIAIQPPATGELVDCAVLAQIQRAVGEMLVALCREPNGPLPRLAKLQGCQLTAMDDMDWNWPAECALGHVNCL